MNKDCDGCMYDEGDHCRLNNVCPGNIKKNIESDESRTITYSYDPKIGCGRCGQDPCKPDCFRD